MTMRAETDHSGSELGAEWGYAWHPLISNSAKASVQRRKVREISHGKTMKRKSERQREVKYLPQTDRAR